MIPPVCCYQFFCFSTALFLHFLPSVSYCSLGKFPSEVVFQLSLRFSEVSVSEEGQIRAVEMEM